MDVRTTEGAHVGSSSRFKAFITEHGGLGRSGRSFDPLWVELEPRRRIAGNVFVGDRGRNVLGQALRHTLPI
jgi:hypothetical protein